MDKKLAELVIARDSYCPVCGVVMGEGHLHHRKLRKHGGPDTAENLIYVHAACHQRIHMNPTESYDNGWLVHSWDDPANTPITPCGDGPWG